MSNDTPKSPPRQPRAHTVDCSESGPVVVEDQELPAKLAETPVEQKSPAQWAYERLILYIKNFEEQLDNEHEIAMGFAGGDAGVLRIEGIGFFDPDIITYYGSDGEGTKTQLVQHVSQLSVMLRALPKQIQSAEPNRIGFRLAAQLEEE
ncbi:DUF6173 family protein [Gelidibacter sp. F2691]|nr:DUF6173 family protein [Gelidibacter sp. F2691]